MKLSACSILIGAVVADYPSYTIPNEPDIIDWGSPFDRQAFRQNELGKDFVRFQMPDDEYVPIEDLPIVCKYYIYKRALERITDKCACYKDYNLKKSRMNHVVRLAG